MKKQQATGRTRDGATFPLTIMLQPKLGKDEKKLKQGGNLASEGSYYEGLVWVFANISGLVSVTPEGLIKNSNHNFSLMLFGYSEKDLVGKVSSTHQNFIFTGRLVFKKTFFLCGQVC